MIIALLLVAVALVSVVERWVKPWGFRLPLILAILCVFSIFAFNTGLSAGESAARSTVARELAEEFNELGNGTETNRTAEVNSDIQLLQARVLKIVAERE